MGEWQLPVRDNLLNGKGYTINPNVKYHYFVNSKSLCGNYWIVSDMFDNVLEENQALKCTDLLCKKCYEKWKNNLI